MRYRRAASRARADIPRAPAQWTLMHRSSALFLTCLSTSETARSPSRKLRLQHALLPVAHRRRRCVLRVSQQKHASTAKAIHWRPFFLYLFCHAHQQRRAQQRALRCQSTPCQQHHRTVWTPTVRAGFPRGSGGATQRRRELRCFDPARHPQQSEREFAGCRRVVRVHERSRPPLPRIARWQRQLRETGTPALSELVAGAE